MFQMAIKRGQSIQNSMTTINSKGERQLSQEELLPLIQTYLGDSLFKQALRYEEVTHTHAPYLDFLHHHVPLHSHLPTPQEKYVFASLFKDVQPQLILHLYLVRVLQYKHTLLCLTLDSELPINDQRFLLLAIVFESKALAQQWRLQYSFLTLLRVAEPYRSRHKISTHSDATLLVTRVQNLKVQAKFRFDQYSPANVRNEGNQKFRAKKYIDALYFYQFALGLAHNPENRRERAILYANSSQCLFEMHLFQSALLYAEASSYIDRTYAKGVYRKYTCYLELGQLKLVPTVLRSISQVCSQAEFQTAQRMFIRTCQHHHGLFDWKELFKGQHLHFSQYYSPSLQKQKGKRDSFPVLELPPDIYVAGKDVSKFQMILLGKPLVYCSSDQEKFGEDYRSLINQIMTYCDLEDNFYQRFQDLPSQCTFNGHILKFNQFNPEGVEMNEIHAKCLRCLQLEKVLSLAQGEKESLGIWDQLYRFQHDCFSNCSFLHVKGAILIFAVRDIPQGEPLSLDFLSWETTKRESVMQEKLGTSCDCQFCKWEWEKDLGERSGELLYQFYKHEIGGCRERGSDKLRLFYLWNLIFFKKFREVELMKEYLLLLQQYPIWECLINCLKYLRVRSRNEAFDRIKSTLKRLFERFFKMGHHQAVDLLKLLL